MKVNFLMFCKLCGARYLIEQEYDDTNELTDKNLNLIMTTAPMNSLHLCNPKHQTFGVAECVGLEKYSSIIEATKLPSKLQHMKPQGGKQ